MKRHLKNVYIISLIMVIIDQFIKAVVSYNMHLYDTFTLIKDFLDINLVHNTGAAFSFLQGGRVLFIVIALIVILIISMYINSNDDVDKKKTLIYSLLLGGIVGNLIDRIFLGYVVDFIGIELFGNSYPIFNIADIFIVVGAIFVIFEKAEK